MALGSTNDTSANSDRNAGKSPDFVESLARGLAVLSTFGDVADDSRQSRLTLSDVAKRTALSRGTARRLLLTLRDLGYIGSDGKLFWLTPRVLKFSNAFLGQIGLAYTAQPILKALTEKLNESSSVGVLDQEEIVYVARVEVRRLYSSGLEVGTRLPAHCSSLGRVLLAAKDDDELAAWLDRHELFTVTQKTIVSHEKWWQAIRRVRKQGYAISDGELEIGIRSLSVPIIGRSGRALAALNTSTSTARVSQDELMTKFLPELERTARELAVLME